MATRKQRGRRHVAAKRTGKNGGDARTSRSTRRSRQTRHAGRRVFSRQRKSRGGGEYRFIKVNDNGTIKKGANPYNFITSDDPASLTITKSRRHVGGLYTRKITALNNNIGYDEGKKALFIKNTEINTTYQIHKDETDIAWGNILNFLKRNKIDKNIAGINVQPPPLP